MIFTGWCIWFEVSTASLVGRCVLFKYIYIYRLLLLVSSHSERCACLHLRYNLNGVLTRQVDECSVFSLCCLWIRFITFIIPSLIGWLKLLATGWSVVMSALMSSIVWVGYYDHCCLGLVLSYRVRLVVGFVTVTVFTSRKRGWCEVLVHDNTRGVSNDSLDGVPSMRDCGVRVCVVVVGT